MFRNKPLIFRDLITMFGRGSPRAPLLDYDLLVRRGWDVVVGEYEQDPPARGRARPGPHEAPSTVKRGACSRTRPRARLTSCRHAASERPTVTATSSQDRLSTSYRTKAVRSGGLSDSRTTSGAMLTDLSRVTRSSGVSGVMPSPASWDYLCDEPGADLATSRRYFGRAWLAGWRSQAIFQAGPASIRYLSHLPRFERCGIVGA